jgi:hypothetical protein
MFTTESQRHRENENDNDPRTGPIIGCVERVLPVHEAQLLTYMRLTGKRVGLLINFNVPLLTKGITRRVL